MEKKLGVKRFGKVARCNSRGRGKEIGSLLKEIQNAGLIRWGQTHRVKYESNRVCASGASATSGGGSLAAGEDSSRGRVWGENSGVEAVKSTGRGQGGRGQGGPRVKKSPPLVPIDPKRHRTWWKLQILYVPTLKACKDLEVEIVENQIVGRIGDLMFIVHGWWSNNLEITNRNPQAQKEYSTYKEKIGDIPDIGNIFLDQLRGKDLSNRHKEWKNHGRYGRWPPVEYFQKIITLFKKIEPKLRAVFQAIRGERRYAMTTKAKLIEKLKFPVGVITHMDLRGEFRVLRGINVYTNDNLEILDCTKPPINARGMFNYIDEANAEEINESTPFRI